MDPKFSILVKQLQPKLESLLCMPPITNGKLPHDMPSGGVYLFTEERRHLYVGRTNDLRGRYGRHCRRGASARHAGFAFILACKTIGKIPCDGCGGIWELGAKSFSTVAV